MPFIFGGALVLVGAVIAIPALPSGTKTRKARGHAGVSDAPPTQAPTAEAAAIIPGDDETRDAAR